MKEENIEKGNTKHKLIIIILIIIIIFLALVGGYFAYKNMNTEPNTPSKPTVSTSSTEKENVSTNNPETSTSKYNFQVEGEPLTSDVVLAIYNQKDNSLIKKIDFANSVEEVEINGKIYYVFSHGFAKGGVWNYDLEVLDEDLNVVIDSSKIPVEYDDTYYVDKYILFTFNYDKTNKLFAVNFLWNAKNLSNNNIYIFDLNGKYINTISNENRVYTYNDIFVTQVNNELKFIDYNNEVKKSITLSDNEAIGYADEYWAVGYFWNLDDLIVGIADKDNLEKLKYSYSYSVKTNELKKKNGFLE